MRGNLVTIRPKQLYPNKPNSEVGFRYYGVHGYISQLPESCNTGSEKRMVNGNSCGYYQFLNSVTVPDNPYPTFRMF